jgi:hypothetical protein
MLAIRPCKPSLFALSSDQVPAKFAGAALTDQKPTIKTQHKLRNTRDLFIINSLLRVY